MALDWLSVGALDRRRSASTCWYGYILALKKKSAVSNGLQLASAAVIW